MMIVTEKSSVIWQSVGCATLLFLNIRIIRLLLYYSFHAVWPTFWSLKCSVIRSLRNHPFMSWRHRLYARTPDSWPHRHNRSPPLSRRMNVHPVEKKERKAPNSKRSDRDIIGYIALWKMIAFRKWVRLADCHLALLLRFLHLIYSACILVYPFRFCFSLISCSVGLIHF